MHINKQISSRILFCFLVKFRGIKQNHKFMISFNTWNFLIYFIYFIYFIIVNEDSENMKKLLNKTVYSKSFFS
jgi:hypothetical protein